MNRRQRCLVILFQPRLMAANRIGTKPARDLQRGFDDTRAFLPVEPLAARDSIGCLQVKPWDEEKQRLVGFNAARA